MNEVIRSIRWRFKRRPAVLILTLVAAFLLSGSATAVWAGPLADLNAGVGTDLDPAASTQPAPEDDEGEQGDDETEADDEDPPPAEEEEDDDDEQDPPPEEQDDEEIEEEQPPADDEQQGDDEEEPSPPPVEDKGEIDPKTGLTATEQARLDELNAKSWTELSDDEKKERTALIRKMTAHIRQTRLQGRQPRQEPEVERPEPPAGDVEREMPERTQRPEAKRQTPRREPAPRLPANIELPEDNYLWPYYERQYGGFALKDVPYSELVEMFARQANLPVVGMPLKVIDDRGQYEEPEGQVTFMTTSLTDFWTTLDKVNDLLYKQIDPPLYLMVQADPQNPQDAYLDLYAVKELRNQLPIDRLFESLEAAQRADLRDSEILRVFVTPEKASDLRVFNGLVIGLLDDATLAAPDSKSGQIDFFGRKDQLDKMLLYMDRFKDVFGTTRFERLEVNHLDASAALEILTLLVDNLAGAATDSAQSKTPRPRRGAKGDDDLALESEKIFALADDAHKVLLVRGLPHKINELKDALDEIDRPFSADIFDNTQVYRLKHAKADEAAEILESVINKNPSAASPSKSPRGRRNERQSALISDTDQIQITALTRTNALLMQGPEALVDRALVVLDNYIDIPVPDEHSFRIIELKYRDPEDIAEIVQSVVGGKRNVKDENPFKAEASAGAVILSGEPGDMDKAEQLISQLDKEDASKIQLFTAKVKNAKPTMVVQILQMMDAGSDGADQSKRRRTRGRRPAGRFHGDDATGMVVFTGTEREWQQDVLPVIKSIDKEAEEVEPGMKFVKIEFEDPEVLVDSLTDLFGKGRKRDPDEQINFAATPNGILITGNVSPGELDAIQEAVEILDVNTAENFVMETFTLQYAEAGVVSAAIKELYGAGAAPRRPRRGKADAGAEEDIRIAVSGKVMIIRTTPEMMDMVKGLVLEMDQKGRDVDKVELARYELQHADAEELASKIEPMLETKAAELDDLSSLESGERGKRRQAKDKISVQADARTNTILVSAPQGIVDFAGELVTVFDVQGEPEQRYSEIYECVNASAEELAGVLNNIYADGAGSVAARDAGREDDDRSRRRAARMRRLRQAMRGGDSDIEILALPGDKALSITAPSREEVGEILYRAKLLDEKSTSSEPVTKTFTIHYSDVEQLATAVVKIFDEQQRASRPSKAAEEEDEFSFLATGSEPDYGKEVTAWGDYDTNTLMVLAPPVKMAAIEMFVAERERINDPGEREAPGVLPFKLYTLKNVDALRALDLFDRFADKFPGVTVDYYMSDTLMIEGNVKAFDKVQGFIEQYVDLPENALVSGPVMSIQYVPAGIPLDEIVQVIQSSMPDVEIEIQDLSSLNNVLEEEKVPEVK